MDYDIIVQSAVGGRGIEPRLQSTQSWLGNDYFLYTCETTVLNHMLLQMYTHQNIPDIK